MNSFRIIPTLLIKEEELVKGKQFAEYRYIGDPINAVKIFNEKEVDEICILDITASRKKEPPNYELVKEIEYEAFMPLSYGGGLNDIDQVTRILQSGAEKVIFNTAIHTNPQLIKQTAEKFGASGTVVSIDVKRRANEYYAFVLNGTVETGFTAVEMAKRVEILGAGEIILTSIDREGMKQGYDINLIEQVSQAVQIPVIANGGAGNKTHFQMAIHAGASAVTAGTYFVFYSKLEGVLITYDI